MTTLFFQQISFENNKKRIPNKKAEDLESRRRFLVDKRMGKICCWKCLVDGLTLFGMGLLNSKMMDIVWY